jgi:hypothetical protein
MSQYIGRELVIEAPNHLESSELILEDARCIPPGPLQPIHFGGATEPA